MALATSCCMVAAQVGRRPGEVENEDVTLAISTRARHSFVPRPPQEALRQIADQVCRGADSYGPHLHGLWFGVIFPER